MGTQTSKNMLTHAGFLELRIFQDPSRPFETDSKTPFAGLILESSDGFASFCYFAIDHVCLFRMKEQELFS